MLRMKKLGSNYFLVRNYCKDNVRVRFAPSPTGYLHLGGLRTALYNFLFSKSKNGTFILRIEDTDQSRQVEGAAQQLKKDLTWAGIEIHEGPNIGGNFGPYVQSQRLDLYGQQITKLLKNGTAYYCFCTERRLDLLRREAVKNREVPKYDNKCRHLTNEETSNHLAKGDKYCIRFKLSSDVTSYEDLVYGKITYDVSLNEGDPVIIKTDGYPTYHFANIVDDHFMKISHVLRGLEWQISTTKHIQMYRAFGWDPPKYGHLPLLLNSDGTKLSKRQNDIKITHFRENGIFPLALLNYVVNAGGGFEKDLQQNIKTRIYTIEDLANQFDVTRLSTHSGRLMPERLFEFNQAELKRLLKNESEEKELLKEVQFLLQEHFKKTLVTVLVVTKFFEMKLENLEGLLQIDCASDMLETWSPWDFRTFLESRPSEFDQLQINLILLLFVDSGLSVFTARTKEIMEILLQDGADPLFKFPVGTNLICINEAPTLASEALKNQIFSRYFIRLKQKRKKNLFVSMKKMSFNISYISLFFLHQDQYKSNFTTLIRGAGEFLLRSNTKLQLDEQHIRSVLHWSANRIKKLSDLLTNDMLFLWTMPKSCELKKDDIASITDLLLELENQDEFSREELSRFLKKFADRQNIKFSSFMKTLRSMLSGLKEGPSIAEMMEILGKSSTLYRLKTSLNEIKV